MEEFLLGTLLAGDELNIIDHQNIICAIRIAELHDIVRLDGVDQVIQKFSDDT